MTCQSNVWLHARVTVKPCMPPICTYIVTCPKVGFLCLKPRNNVCIARTSSCMRCCVSILKNTGLTSNTWTIPKTLAYYDVPVRNNSLEVFHTAQQDCRFEPTSDHVSMKERNLTKYLPGVFLLNFIQASWSWPPLLWEYCYMSKSYWNQWQ